MDTTNWLEEQLSAGHFGTDSNHSRCRTSVADGAYLLTCMIGGFEDFCDRLVESLEYLHLAIGQCWFFWFATFDPCLWILASFAAVFKNLPISFLPRGAFMYHT